MNIGTVVEGPTDRLILESVLNHLIPGEHNYLPLHPKPTFGDTGTGWKGVRRWCRQTWQREGYSLEKIFHSNPNSPLDMLVIHIDADIADEDDLQEGNDEIIHDMNLPCPPIEDTVNQLRRVIRYWLKLGEYPQNVVLAIPAQDTENWIFAALFPEDDLCLQDDYECIKKHHKKPAFLLSLEKYGKLTGRGKNGEIKKSVIRYRNITDNFVNKWDTVCRICLQADNLNNAMKGGIWLQQ